MLFSLSEFLDSNSLFSSVPIRFSFLRVLHFDFNKTRSFFISSLIALSNNSSNTSPNSLSAINPFNSALSISELLEKTPIPQLHSLYSIGDQCIIN